jgi:hypothetical protein
LTRPGPPPEPPVPSRGQHLATISHDGRFWDVFVESEQDPARAEIYRALFCFSPSDLNAGERPTRTTTIIVESTYEEAIQKARSFEEHQLVGLLRSTLPD